MPKEGKKKKGSQKPKQVESKLLNLDDMVPEERKFKYRGKEYVLAPISVGKFLQLGPEMDKLTNIEAAGITNETLEAAIKFTVSVIPDMEEEALRDMPLVQINALFGFVNEYVKSMTTTAEEKKSPSAETS